MEQRAVSLEPQPLEPEHLVIANTGLHDLLVCLIETTHLGDHTLVAKPNRMVVSRGATCRQDNRGAVTATVSVSISTPSNPQA
jgi:hypothetical protein